VADQQQQSRVTSEDRLGFAIAFWVIYLVGCLPLAAVFVIGTLVSDGQIPLRGVLYGALLAIVPLASYRRLRDHLLGRR
jgi:uncharacterized membrane protein